MRANTAQFDQTVTLARIIVEEEPRDMEPMIQILHLEDDPTDAGLVQARLAQAGLSFHISLAQTREEFEAVLRNDRTEIILADFKLPTFDGMSALRMARECFSEIPFVFVSGVMGEEVAIEALTHGATDYVLKHNLSRLPTAVKRALQEARNRNERKQAQEALQHTNELLRAIIEAAPVAIAGLDLDGCVQSVWNPAAERMFGWSSQEVIGRPLPTIPVEDLEEFRRLKRQIRNGITLDGKEVHRLRRDGTPIDYSVYATPLKDAEGRICGNVAVLLDITERKTLEDQLHQSQKMEAIGQLAGGVAHDFNNMLGVIIGRAQLILNDDTLDETLHHDIEQILSAGNRSAEITRQLLAFARKQTIAPKLLDLNETVEGMLKLLRRLIGEEIELAWLPGTKLWPVKMDPSQIDQILANLCVNARDAIDGVGKITIKTQNIDFDETFGAEHGEFPSGEYLMLAVSDDGCGIKKPTINKIFEPFFTTKDLGKGTGLGLATVYGIVKQNSGHIKVFSELGHGSTFTIYLPRCTDKVVLREEEEAWSVHPILTGNETILVAEDEISHLKTVKMLLERYGYQVLAASTPHEAIALAREHTGDIHLLLSDVIMPEMNGRDLAIELTSFLPNIISLFMSGYSSPIIGDQGVLDEEVHFLEKPFTKQALAAKVRKVLDGY